MSQQATTKVEEQVCKVENLESVSSESTLMMCTKCGSRKDFRIFFMDCQYMVTCMAPKDEDEPYGEHCMTDVIRQA